MEMNSETIPAGLLLIADFVARVPERGMDAIERKRQAKELALLSIQQMKRTFSWNPKRTIWVAILIWFTAFTTLWSMSTVLGMFRTTGQTIGGTMKQLTQLGIELPPNVASPFGSAIGVADSIPSFGIADALAISFGAVVLYGIYKFITVMPNLDRLHILNAEEQRLEEEVRYLNQWMSQLIGQSMERK